MNAIKTATQTLCALTVMLWANGAAGADAGPDTHRSFDFVVTTQPDSTVVSLDDSIRGVTPIALTGIAGGSHTLLLRKKGYYIKKAVVTLDASSPKKFSFTLLKPAVLLVTSDPAGAILAIDGRNEGIAPFLNDKMKPGDHAISARIKGYQPIDRTVTLASGTSDTVRLVFERPVGYRDSVAAFAKAQEKAGKERRTIAVLTAIFCLVAIVLIVMETGGK